MAEVPFFIGGTPAEAGRRSRVRAFAEAGDSAMMVERASDGDPP